MTALTACLAETDVAADALAARYREVRRFTERICEPLSAEDCVVQSMPEASPTRWHLAHTTWFFETFVLTGQPGYRAYHPQFNVLFNSYYNTVGQPYPRPRRGLISRPSLKEILLYREYVDNHVLDDLDEQRLPAGLTAVVQLGLNHEQQHQELILTDIKHALSCNPLEPAYHRDGRHSQPNDAGPMRWIEFPEGIREIGHDGVGFAYDNESPRHPVFLDAFQLAGRPVTCGEFLDFIEDGGYRRHDLWLDLGWHAVREEKRDAPLYWSNVDGQWQIFTLAGLKPLDRDEPLCHIDYFEADAFARWAGARLPTEAEWETAAAEASMDGNFVNTLLAEDAPIHPRTSPSSSTEPARMFGDVWEWTSSDYAPYPGYRPADGALGEYNGKFMCSQYVLRGGSCATPASHIRRSYRNFFPPTARWQFTGIRLAR